MSAKPGEMFYFHVDLNADMSMKQIAMYAEDLTNEVAMLEVLNKIDGTKLSGLL